MRPLRSNAGSGRRGGVIFILALVLSLPILAVWLFRSRGRPPTGIRSLKLLLELKKRSNPSHSNSSEIAMIYASLGDADQAMNWLEKGYEDRFNPGVLLRPGFDPLRAEARCQDLVHRIGLPG